MPGKASKNRNIIFYVQNEILKLLMKDMVVLMIEEKWEKQINSSSFELKFIQSTETSLFFTPKWISMETKTSKFIHSL